MADLAAKIVSERGDPNQQSWMFPGDVVAGFNGISTREFSRGNQLGNRCLAYGNDSPSRLATIYAIMAMSDWHWATPRTRI